MKSNQRRILVVDDNEDTAAMLAEVLGPYLGHSVMIAHDGPSAVEIATRFRPEIALLDIGLPVMDGYELAEHLRTLIEGLRIFAVTGYGQESDRRRAQEAGFDGHVIKPIDVDQLRRIVESNAGPK